MKTLHTAYHVTDLAASLGFCVALGRGEVGRVDIGDGATLAMLKFPAKRWSRWNWSTSLPASRLRRYRVHSPRRPGR